MTLFCGFSVWQAVFEDNAASARVRGYDDNLFDREGALAPFVPRALTGQSLGLVLTIFGQS